MARLAEEARAAAVALGADGAAAAAAAGGPGAAALAAQNTAQAINSSVDARLLALVRQVGEARRKMQEGEPEDTELQVLDEVHYREVLYF